MRSHTISRTNKRKLWMAVLPAAGMTRRLDLHQHAHPFKPTRSDHCLDICQAVALTRRSRGFRQLRMRGQDELKRLGISWMPVQDVVLEPAEQPHGPDERLDGEKVMSGV